MRRQGLPPAPRLDRPEGDDEVQPDRDRLGRNRKRENRKFERARMFGGRLEDLRRRRGSAPARKSVSVQNFSGSQKNGISQCHHAGRCQVTSWQHPKCTVVETPGV